MAGQTIKTESERIADIRIQSSAYGSCIPWLLAGRGRVAGNLVWYGNFRAIQHTETTSGGKGGAKQQSVTYTYEAAVIVGLSRGTLVGAGAVWRGKEQLASLTAAGFSLAKGELGQPIWSWLQGYAPAEALNYSGLAYAYAQNYALDSTASLPNHNFELDAGGLGAVPGVDEPVVDGCPRDAVQRLLTDTRSGGAWPLERLQGLDRYQAYCRAAGLWLSPVLSEQRSAIDWLKQLLMLTNTRGAYTGTALELVPLGDEDLSAHGATFTAEVTPDFDLTLDDFAPDDGEPPVRIRRHVGLSSEAATASSDDVGYNVITLEIEDRASGYVTQPISRSDLASIEQYGRRPKDAIKAPEIKSAAIADQVAQQLLQDELAKRNRYEFNLPWRYCLLKPLRLVTLTDPAQDLDRHPVRVLEVEELDDRRIAVVAEDAPIGIATAPRFGQQAGQGYSQNYAVAPGSVTDAAFFEAPAALAAGSTGLEVWCAVASPGASWGGCTVWVSLDGDSYRVIGRVNAAARMGVLSAPITGGVLQVSGLGGQLVGGSAEDAQALATLSVVLGSTPEYLAYEQVTLVGAGAYSLGGLVRGAYGSPSPAHQAGDRFVRIDDAIVKSGGLDVSYIGKRIWFKLTSFNVFGAAEESLADVAAMPYDVTGGFAQAAPGTAGRGLVLKASALAVKQDSGGSRLPAAITLTAELKGSLLGSPSWTVVSGAATLSGTGLQRTVAASSITGPARIRVALTDEVATYADEVTLTVLSDGAAGADGAKYALVSLYQWATVQPAAPNGQSTWTWATATQSAYTGGNGWQVGLPANPGGAGLRLWSATQQVSAAGGVASTTVGWGAGVAVVSVGANGVGQQSAEAAVYAWAVNLASVPALAGSSTWTWATSTLDTAPSGWSLSPGSSASPGLTLYKAAVRLQDASTQSTSTVNWTLAGVSAVGYAGQSGGDGQQGASYRIAYAKVSGATIGAGTVTTEGSTSFPPANSWGRGETWGATLPTYGADESVMISNGVYNPATGQTVWGSPYLANWRVGKLSAITADIGDITAGSLNINNKFVVSADGYLVARGVQLQDESGNVVLSTRASSSAALPSSWVTAAPGWLNSNASSTNLLWGAQNGPYVAGPGQYGGTLFWLKTATSNPLGLRPGETLTLSADMVRDATAAADGAYAQLYVWAQRSDGIWTMAVTASSSSLALARVSGTATLPSTEADMDGIGIAIFHQGGATNTAGTVRAERVQLERGIVASLYSPGAEPGATVGAPAGTSVAGQSAESLVADAATAKSTANTAASNATSALSALATMRSNGYIDASEKPALIKQWQAVYAERPGIYNSATAYGRTTERDAYQSAYMALASYLGGLSPSWDDTSTDTPITPAVDQSTWASYYSARQAVLDAISAEAGQRATWASVTGTGKPQDNATVGATVGVNLGGSFSQSSWDVVMNGQALIRAAHIQQLTTANLTVTTLSQVLNGSVSSGGRTEHDAVGGGRIRIYDDTNALRIKIGYLL